MKKILDRLLIMFMNLFNQNDDIDWLNMHNDMIEKGDKNENK
jgi:hypothetical protein